MLFSDPRLKAVLSSLNLAPYLFKAAPATHSSFGFFDDPPATVSDIQCIPLPEGPAVECQAYVPQPIPAAMSTNFSAPNSALPTPLGIVSKLNGTHDHNASSVNAQDATCFVESYNPLAVSIQAFPPFDEARASVYRYRQQHGVNLGSWFVHEKWMTPSLFVCASGNKVSELDIASGWGSTASARALLERHWDTFVTADDFKYLASIGINTVRLPVGYWNLGPPYCQNTPFEPVSDVYRNSWARIVRAINMAAEVGIGVLVDLHGAVGSQNGQPHSGISDGQTLLFTNPAYQTQTIAVLTFLVQQLAPVANVIGIQLLNEPQNVPQLADFYTRTLTALRQVSAQAASFPFYIHDGFDLQRFGHYVSDRRDFVVQDHHSYFVFTSQDSVESADKHTQDITGSIGQSFSAVSQNTRNNLVIDEWSCALTPQSLAKERDPEFARKQFCEGQMKVYENSSAGWAFWSYNKESCASDEGWCFKNAVGKALPSSFFSYAGTVPTPAGLSAILNMHSPNQSTILDRASPGVSDPGVLSTETQGFMRTPKLVSEILMAGTHTSKGGVSMKSANPGKREQRFTAVHSRRQALLPFSESPPLSVAQAAVVKGYSYGFFTAKSFAAFNLSKLGFVGQYIEDSLGSPDFTIDEGQQDIYRLWFRKGLADGEAQVWSIVLAM